MVTVTVAVRVTAGLAPSSIDTCTVCTPASAAVNTALDEASVPAPAVTLSDHAKVSGAADWAEAWSASGSLTWRPDTSGVSCAPVMGGTAGASASTVSVSGESALVSAPSDAAHATA